MTDSSTSADGWRWLEPILGKRVVAARPITQPWSTPTQTTVLTIGAGTRVVVQTADARAIANRARFGQHLSEVAPWLPLPRVIAADTDGSPAWLITSFIDGVSGRVMLSSPTSTRALGELVGRLAAALARVPIAGLPAPGVWGGHAELDAAARAWQAGIIGRLDSRTTRRLDRLIDDLPAVLGAAPPVFAHGDLVPVNLIVRSGVIAGLVDLEHARIADRQFDLAWFRWTLRRHHPDAVADASRSALLAAGLTDDARTRRRLDLLAVLRCLEVLADMPASAGARDQLVAAVDSASRSQDGA